MQKILNYLPLDECREDKENLFTSDRQRGRRKNYNCFKYFCSFNSVLTRFINIVYGPMLDL